jgi:hypothetical protein
VSAKVREKRFEVRGSKFGEAVDDAERVARFELGSKLSFAPIQNPKFF